MAPVCGAVFCDGDVVCAVEDGSYAVDVEEGGGERGRVRRREGGARGEIFEVGGGEVFGEYAVVWPEFESLRRYQCYVLGLGKHVVAYILVGCIFSLDEEGSPIAKCRLSCL